MIKHGVLIVHLYLLDFSGVVKTFAVEARVSTSSSGSSRCLCIKIMFDFYCVERFVDSKSKTYNARLNKGRICGAGMTDGDVT